SGPLDKKAVRQIATALGKSRRPVLLVGHGVIISRAHRELRALAEKLQVPVATTLLGKGAFPESHPLSLGMVGMHGTAYANKALVDCDLVMSIGSRYDDRIIGQPSLFCREAVRIHVDIDPAEFGKMISCDVTCSGDAREVIQELLQQASRLDTAEWVARVNGFKKQFPLHFRKKGGLKMQHVMQEIHRITEGKAIIVTDVGQHQMWAAQFCRTDEPNNFLTSGGAGTMGFGMPAALGAQFGRPGETVVAIVGDGGFQMTSFELATAALHKLPVKIIVMNNHYLGMVRQWQELFYDDRKSGVDLEGNPDFVKLAEAYPGIRGFNLKRAADVRKILRRAWDITDGPVLINAEVEKTDNVYPMIPAGRPLTDMIIEKPRHKMEKPTGST
ncbi:MAG: thiamine pyrophosphate-dependent enzyme, partial [Kiritimatiellia bacterium]|nr:thiamine pyrophosphate-dependent enzyme [Kiritimatiellia bacterium]